MLTEKQKALCFYALEAMSRTLRMDDYDNKKFYFRQDEYYPDITELEKIGTYVGLMDLMDKTLGDLC